MLSVLVEKLKTQLEKGDAPVELITDQGAADEINIKSAEINGQKIVNVFPITHN